MNNNKTNTITYEKSKYLKGVAVILMVCYHTFASPNMIPSYEWKSLFMIKEMPIEYYFFKTGAICVLMFSFLSGYGIYEKYRDNMSFYNILQRIKNIYINYWIVFFIFILFKLIIGEFSFNIKDLIKGFIGDAEHYNITWWYIRLYVMLILIYPLICKIINKYNFKKIIVISFLINIIGLILTKAGYLLNINNFVYSNVSILLGGQFQFVSGVIISKEKLFDIYKERGINNKKAIVYATSIFIVMIILEFIPVLGMILKIALIPIFIYFLSNIKYNSKILLIIGKNSTNIWLTHSFFCYYMFMKLGFYFKYSVLVFIWIIFLSLIFSFIINKILIIGNKISIMNKEYIIKKN